MWSKEGEAPTLLSTSLVLDKTLEIPDSGKIWCELEVLGGEVLVSHNVTLNVLCKYMLFWGSRNQRR